MAQRFFKGRTNNHLTWVMVDATDFATPESALSAATKIKIYGKLRAAAGVNFVSSGTGSLTNDITHVGASALGIYSIGLAKADLSDASAAWYDQYIISLSATGAAYQTIIAEGVIDDSNLSGVVSDIYSALVALSDATSNAYSAAVVGASRVLVVQSLASDAHSAAAQANSRVLIVQSRLSDFDSRIVSDLSDVLSAVNVGNSRLLVGQSYLSDIRSHLSDIQSDFQSRVPKLVATNSQVSDLGSDLRSLLAAGVSLDASTLSDLRSAITAGAPLQASDMSDLRSAIAAVTLTLDASALSDIGSAVWANAIGTRVDSRVLVAQSYLSDIRSQLTAGVELGASSMSDLRSAVNAVTVNLTASDISNIASAVLAGAAGLTASEISDIASAVWANAVGARVDSRVLLTLSQVSDLVSAVAAGVTLGPSSLSDIRSAITAGGGATIDASALSDIASAVWADTIGARVDSRLRVVQSQASDIYSLLGAGVELGASSLSDLRSMVAATELDASDLSDIGSAVWANAIGTRVDSRVALVNSGVSDIYSLVTAGVPLGASALSDLRSAIAAAELDASDLSDIASAVWARAGADPTGVIAPTAGMGAKLDWVAALARNQVTQTSGVQTLYNDGLSAVASAVVSDDGSVFTRGEFA